MSVGLKAGSLVSLFFFFLPVWVSRPVCLFICPCGSGLRPVLWSEWVEIKVSLFIRVGF